MPSLLTGDDLDDIGIEIVRTRDPRPYLTELVDAVDHGRIADADDIGYALALAAETADLCHDAGRALQLAARRVDATEGTEEHDAARGHRAELLLRYGHEDEGMRELEALRPRLTRDLLAVDYLGDALTETGRAELAEQWLTAALSTALEIAERADDADPDADATLDAWEIVDRLAARRRSVRQDLGLAPDAADELAAQHAAAAASTPDLLFWPEAAFAEVTAALGVGEVVAEATWDEHRAAIEAEFRLGDEDGEPPRVEVATPGLLAAVLAGDHDTPTDPGPLLSWPPGRNEPCWCGSRAKYKKCCLPRGRA